MPHIVAMGVAAKICGLRTAETMDAAVAGGARFVGLVFYPPSPRLVTPDRAAALAARVPEGVERVGLFVDATDDAIATVLASVPLTLIQLQGRETPARVAAVRARFGLPVMKAVPIAAVEDLATAESYDCEWLLFDAKPPKRADALPGGNAERFDWSLLADRRIDRPWMLAGGLDAGNVAEAVRITGAPAVDVSSGVERARGEKDVGLIAAFLEAVAAIS